MPRGGRLKKYKLIDTDVSLHAEILLVASIAGVYLGVAFTIFVLDGCGCWDQGGIYGGPRLVQQTFSTQEFIDNAEDFLPSLCFFNRLINFRMVVSSDRWANSPYGGCQRTPLLWRVRQSEPFLHEGNAQHCRQRKRKPAFERFKLIGGNEFDQCSHGITESICAGNVCLRVFLTMRSRFTVACFMTYIFSANAYAEHRDWGVLQFPQQQFNAHANNERRITLSAIGAILQVIISNYLILIKFYRVDNCFLRNPLIYLKNFLSFSLLRTHQILLPHVLNRPRSLELIFGANTHFIPWRRI